MVACDRLQMRGTEGRANDATRCGNPERSTIDTDDTSRLSACGVAFEVLVPVTVPTQASKDVGVGHAGFCGQVGNVLYYNASKVV
jgi:hypothetical protein